MSERLANGPLLPEAARSVVPSAQANLGLVFDKYGGYLRRDDKKCLDFDKSRFAERVEKRRDDPLDPGAIRCLDAEGEARLDRALRRRADLVRAVGGRCVRFVADSRITIGLGYAGPHENGMEFHPTLGVPYAPASGVKGMLRAWVDVWSGDTVGPSDDDVEVAMARVFGSADEREATAGDVIFFDALPCPPVILERDVMTPHYRDYHQASGVPPPPGDWSNPVPIAFFTVRAGTTFVFAMAPRLPSSTRTRPDAVERARTSFENALEWLPRALDEIGLGAKTASGYGRFSRLP